MSARLSLSAVLEQFVLEKGELVTVDVCVYDAWCAVRFGEVQYKLFMSEGGERGSGSSRERCLFVPCTISLYQHVTKYLSRHHVQYCIPTPPSIDFCLSFITIMTIYLFTPILLFEHTSTFYQHTHITNPPEADLRYVVTSPPVMFRPTPSFLAVMCGAMIGRCPWPLIIVDVSRIYYVLSHHLFVV